MSSFDFVTKKKKKFGDSSNYQNLSLKIKADNDLSKNMANINIINYTLTYSKILKLYLPKCVTNTKLCPKKKDSYKSILNLNESSPTSNFEFIFNLRIFYDK